MSRPERSRRTDLVPLNDVLPSDDTARLLRREREANRRLREASRRQTEYVSTASHELRTPLAAIIGFVKTLRQPGFSEDPELREELLARTERQAERLMRMLEQLLSSTAQEDRAERRRPEPFAFASLVDEIADSAAGGRVDRDLPEDLPEVVSDRNTIGLILSNLVGNALKFSLGAGACTVGARMERERFVFWVEDDGTGMTPEELAHAFEPFYQGETARSSESSGVGLGLYVVRRLVDVLEGQVLAQSAPGIGTRFEVTLPRLDLRGS